MGQVARRDLQGFRRLMCGGVCGGLIGGGVFVLAGLFLAKDDMSLMSGLAGTFLIWIGTPVGLLVGCIAGIRIARGKRMGRHAGNFDQSSVASPADVLEIADDGQETARTASIIVSASGLTFVTVGFLVVLIAWVSLYFIEGIVDESSTTPPHTVGAIINAIIWLILGGMFVCLPAVIGAVLSVMGMITAAASGRRTAGVAISVGRITLLGSLAVIVLAVMKALASLG